MQPRRDVPRNVLHGDGGDPVRLRGERDEGGDEGEREPPRGERPLGGAAEEEPGLGEDHLRPLARGGGQRGRGAHGALERGGVVEGRERGEREVGGDAGDEVGERGHRAEGGLGGLGQGEREAVGPRYEEGAGGGEGREEGGALGGEVAARGGLGHGERLVGGGGGEAEAGGDGGDGDAAVRELLVPVLRLRLVVDEGGGAEVVHAVVGADRLVDELRRAGVVDAAAGGADEHTGVRVRHHRALAARPARRLHRAPRRWRPPVRGRAARLAAEETKTKTKLDGGGFDSRRRRPVFTILFVPTESRLPRRGEFEVFGDSKTISPNFRRKISKYPNLVDSVTERGCSLQIRFRKSDSGGAESFSVFQ